METDLTDEEIIEKMGLYASAQSDYSPTGQPFWSNGFVRRTKTRILVTQRGGMDI